MGCGVPVILSLALGETMHFAASPNFRSYSSDIFLSRVRSASTSKVVSWIDCIAVAPSSLIRTPAPTPACVRERNAYNPSLRCAEFNEQEGPDLERLCQGVSPNDEPCGYPATVHCPSCRRWFCDAHAEEEDWHSCVREPGEEGGEA